MGSHIFARIPWFRSEKQVDTIVGVSLCTNMLLAVTLKKQKQQWYVSDTASETVHDTANSAEQIAQFVKSICKGGAKVFLLVPQSYYQIVQTEKPALEHEELLQSLPWTLKELVTLPPENIIADYIDYPIQQAGQPAKISVFAADKNLLTPLVNALNTQELQLQKITVKETAIADMTANDNYARMVIYQEPGQEPSLMIIREQQLLLNRRLRGFALLESSSDEITINNLSDSLGLEIQRSMDFYESQLKQPPIKEVLFHSSFPTEQIITRLNQFQSVPIKVFKPVMDLAEVVEPKFYVALASAYFPLLEQA